MSAKVERVVCLITATAGHWLKCTGERAEGVGTDTLVDRDRVGLPCMYHQSVRNQIAQIEK
jgi:hypothetical protein